MKSNKLTIVKGKNRASKTNPDGLKMNFKIVGGARFMYGNWER